MGKRWTWVAWSMLAVSAVALASTAVLAVLNGTLAGDPVALVYLPTFTAFMAVGALVVARRPANVIGWLFSAIGLLALGASVAGEYSQYAYVTRAIGPPFGVVAAWYLAWAAFPVFGLTFTYLLLLFPTGQTLGPSVSRTWVAWPSALTLCQARSILPCSSTRNVERSTPTVVLPYKVFSPQAP